MSGDWREPVWAALSGAGATLTGSIWYLGWPRAFLLFKATQLAQEFPEL